MSTRVVLEAIDKTKAGIDSAKGNLGQLSTAATTLNGTLARLAPLLGAATFTAFVKNSIDAADRLDDLSQRTGVAVETLAGLELVAKLGDTSLDALGKGINRLSIFMAENSERARELGITSQESDKAFVQLARTLSSIENVNTRNSIANEILGKSYQELLPVLLQGGDSLEALIKQGQELNPVTSEMAARAGLFNDQLDILRGKARQVGISLANDLLPSLNDIASAMLEASKESSGFYTLFIGFGGVADLLFNGTEAKKLKDRIEELEDDIKSSRARLKALPGDSILEAIYGTKETKDALAKQEAELLASKRRLDELLNPKRKEQPARKTTGEDFEIKGSSSKSPTETIQEQIKLQQVENSLVRQGVALEDAKTIAKLRQQGISDELIVQQLNLNQASRQLADEEKLRTEDKKKSEKERLDYEKQMQDALKKGDEERAEFRREQAEREINAQKTLNDTLEMLQMESDEIEFQLSIQGLSQEVQAEKIAARNIEIELQKLLNDLAQDGLHLSEEEVEALRDKYKEIEKTRGKLKETNSTAKDIGLTFKSALEDAIVSGEKFSDVLKGLEQDILRVLSRRTVTKPLMKGLDSLLDGFDLGAFIPGLFANANGNAFNRQGVIPFAKGGVVNRATPFMFGNGGRLGVMGEAGPEAILPLKRGANGQLGVQSGGRDGMPIVNVNIIGAPSQPQVGDVRNDGNGNMSIDIIFDAIKGSLTKDIRSEGTFAQTLQGQYGLNRAAGAR